MVSKIGIAAVCCLLSISVSAQLSRSDKRLVKKSVQTQMRYYPKSELQDIYKNFFQDRFGPGHILADTSRAGAYLRGELAEEGPFAGADYEPTGYQGNFVRVNLSVIADGRIPYNIYFDAFVRSVNGIKQMPVSEWKELWTSIDEVIERMHLDLPDYQTQRKAIFDLLDRGEYVVHHSAAFNEAHQFHYRIISKELFEKEILPYIL